MKLLMTLDPSIVNSLDISGVSFKIPKQDSQEQIQQDYRSYNYKGNKVDVSTPALAPKSTIENYLPIVTD
jgi:hypothetical protein